MLVLWIDCSSHCCPLRCIVVNAKLVHNHSLPQTVAASLPYQTKRGIPSELDQVALELQGYKLPHEIHSILIRMAAKRSLPVSWTASDIRTRYPMQGGLGHFWHTEDLLEQLNMDGRQYKKRVDQETAVLQELVWLQHDGDMEVVLSAANCIVFDNTFNTNTLHYKLGIFTTVDRHGNTRLVSGSLMLSETRESFTWVLDAFRQLLGQKPEVILTDGDPWLGDAVAALGSVHLLCTWHLSKNLWKKIHPCLKRYNFHCDGENKDAWREWINLWWRLCWKSDVFSQESFDHEWLRLKQNLVDNAVNISSDTLYKALRYLGGPKLSAYEGYDDEDDAEYVEDEDFADVFSNLHVDGDQLHGGGGVDGDNPLGASSSTISPPSRASSVYDSSRAVPAQHSGEASSAGGPNGAGASSSGVGVDAAGESLSPDGTSPPSLGAALHVPTRLRYTVYGSRRKWAYRFTNSYFTHGAASSQRAEGVFSEIKHRIIAGASLVSLYQQIGDLVARKLVDNNVRNVRRELNGNTVVYSPLVQSMEKRGCSVWLCDIAENHVYRQSFYKHATKEPEAGSSSEDPQEWYVWHWTGNLEPQEAADIHFVAESGRVPQLMLDTLDDQPTILKHVTTRESCSCQYPQKYGIFCVHQAHVYCLLGEQEPPESVTANVWLPRSEQDVESAREHYTELSLPGPLASVLGDPPSEGVPGSIARYQLCMDLGRLLAHVAEGSPNRYQDIATALRSLAKKHAPNQRIRQRLIPPISGSPRRTLLSTPALRHATPVPCHAMPCHAMPRMCICPPPRRHVHRHCRPHNCAYSCLPRGHGHGSRAP